MLTFALFVDNLFPKACKYAQIANLKSKNVFRALRRFTLPQELLKVFATAETTIPKRIAKNAPLKTFALTNRIYGRFKSLTQSTLLYIGGQHYGR